MSVMQADGRPGAAGRAESLRAARALADELALLVGELAAHEAPDHDTPLGRLVRGTAGAEDLLRLGMPVPGCRLLVVGVPPRDSLTAELRATRLPFTWHDDDLVVLVPQARQAASLAQRLSRLSPGARAGVSSALGDPTDVPAGFAEARRVRRVTCADLSFADESWAELALEELGRVVASALPLSSPLHELARVRPEFLATLVTWLQCDGDVAAAARESALHRNTLRYRLRSIEKQVGIDLSDHDTRFLARLFLTSRSS